MLALLLRHRGYILTEGMSTSKQSQPVNPFPLLFRTSFGGPRQLPPHNVLDPFDPLRSVSFKTRSSYQWSIRIELSVPTGLPNGEVQNHGHLQWLGHLRLRYSFVVHLSGVREAPLHYQAPIDVYDLLTPSPDGVPPTTASGYDWQRDWMSWRQHP